MKFFKTNIGDIIWTDCGKAEVVPYELYGCNYCIFHNTNVCNTVACNIEDRLDHRNIIFKRL